MFFHYLQNIPRAIHFFLFQYLETAFTDFIFFVLYFINNYNNFFSFLEYKNMLLIGVLLNIIKIIGFFKKSY